MTDCEFGNVCLGIKTQNSAGRSQPETVINRVGIPVRFYRYTDNRCWFARTDISADK